MTATTLVDSLRQQAATRGEAPAVTFLEGGETEHTWTFAELDRRARSVAVALREQVEPGERVLLLYPQGLEYVAALYGCMYAGVLAVPLQPPGKHRAKHALPKLEAIVADGGAALVATVAPMVADMRAVVGQSEALAELPFLATDTVEADPESWEAPELGPDDLAYLQYTSGSTSTPKGVMVSHANLIVNLETFDVDYGHDADSVMVSWLPTFHDLGLVYGVFLPLWKGFRTVLLGPLDFLRRPLRWPAAVSRFRGTHSPAPNFAFDLAAARSTPEERAALDLSCWKVALNGAEPIRYESEAHFVEAFAEAGVSWTTISHAYGMSESTAVISKEPVGTQPVFLDVDGSALERHEVVPVDADAPSARRLAGCGVAVEPTTVVAVDPETRDRLGPDRVGELWVGGPTRAQGYWNRPEDTHDGFFATTSDVEGPWLRTGDLGFVRDGQVFVTGRLKDLIIVRGENHYPQDVEWSVQQAHPAVRPSCVAAFTLEAGGGTEGLGIVAEVYPDRLDDPEALFAAVRDAVGEHGLAARTIALIEPRAIFKTSSGKIMRRRTRQSLLDDELPLVARWDAAAPEAVDVPAADDLRATLTATPEHARADVVEAHVLALAAAKLGLDDPEALDPDAPLRELGFDSVQAVELAERLSEDLGVELPATVLFDHPSAQALAEHVASEGLFARTEDVPPTSVPESAPSDVVSSSDEDDGLEGLSAEELSGLLDDELSDL